MTRVVLSEDAEIDLSNIWMFVAEDSVATADTLLDRIHDVCRMLADVPEAGRDRSDLVPRLRSFPVTTFVVFYRRSRRGIEVVRVLSGFRDMPGLFQSGE